MPTAALGEAVTAFQKAQLPKTTAGGPAERRAAKLAVAEETGRMSQPRWVAEMAAVVAAPGSGRPDMAEAERAVGEPPPTSAACQAVAVSATAAVQPLADGAWGAAQRRLSSLQVRISTASRAARARVQMQ